MPSALLVNPVIPYKLKCCPLGPKPKLTPTGDQSLHTVILSRIDEVNDHVRVFRLEVPPEGGSIEFLPGQWLDTYVPDIPKPGGFTITSPPSKARRSADSGGPVPYLELAVQKSPDNAVAQWLWQPTDSILHSQLRVRVGGSFVWPPPGIEASTLKKVVFVAGGVGINPLISILSHIAGLSDEAPSFEVQFLYSLKDPGPERDAGSMPFIERLAAIFSREKVKGAFHLFLTSASKPSTESGNTGVLSCNEADLLFNRRRISREDLIQAVGNDKTSVVVYICGLPTMTDEFVAELISPQGQAVESNRVLCEKWW